MPGEVLKHPVGHPIPPIVREDVVAVAADVVQPREAKPHDLTNPASIGTRFRHKFLVATDCEAGLLLVGGQSRGSGQGGGEWEARQALPLLLHPTAAPPLPLSAHQPAH